MDMHECTWDWCDVLRVYVGVVWICMSARGTGVDVHRVYVDVLWICMSARGTGLNVHRVHVRLVWMCNEHTRDLYG